MAKVAIVYETNQELESVEVGRIWVERGTLVGEPASNSSVEFILGRSLVRKDTGEVVSPEGDPVRFLEALPAGYTGILLRVGLVDATPPDPAPRDAA